ncbi:hypothetical protein BH23BAC4_BH23BAC4_04870 [soil metagenome]
MPHDLPPALELHPLARSLFPGFDERAFEILRSLRESPSVAHFQTIKSTFDRAVRAPFRLYRDELAIRLVLPNQLPFETERNVFSRIPRNDFGKGGAHHYYWMAFYRFGLSRLQDVQLSHGLHPDRFVVGFYVGAQANHVFEVARERLVGNVDVVLPMLNALFQAGFVLELGRGTTRASATLTVDKPVEIVPEEMSRAQAIWVSRSIPRETVVALGPRLVDRALETLALLWPLYVFCTRPSRT